MLIKSIILYQSECMDFSLMLNEQSQSDLSGHVPFSRYSRGAAI